MLTQEIKIKQSDYINNNIKKLSQSIHKIILLNFYLCKSQIKNHPILHTVVWCNTYCCVDFPAKLHYTSVKKK